MAVAHDASERPATLCRHAPSGMDQIFGEIGKALGGFFGSPVVQFVIHSIAVYLVVLWLAGAVLGFRDMQQRTENPILPYLAASLVIVFTPILFPLAIFVYKIIRPHEKIGEVYERNLAEEALLAEVEAIQQLPDLRPAGQRRVDHLPDLPDPPEPGLPELQPPRRARLVAVRLVRQGLRAAATGSPPAAGRRRSRRCPAGDETGRIAAARRRSRRATAAGRVAAGRRPRRAPRTPRRGRTGRPAGRVTTDPRRRRRIAPTPARSDARRRCPDAAADAARRRRRPAAGAVDLHDRGPRRARPVRRRLAGARSLGLGARPHRRARRRRGARPLLRRARSSLSIGLVAARRATRRSSAGPRGDAYAGPSPFLVFAAASPRSRPRGFLVAARRCRARRERSPVPSATCIGGRVQALVFLGVVRLMVVGTGRPVVGRDGLAPARSRGRVADLLVGRARAPCRSSS